MADIELVIKIPENTYHQIQALVRADYFEHDICGNSMRRIANGTPLPKGHGSLKDADKLKRAFVMWSMAVQGNFTDADIASIIYNSKTIIEADKAESEDKE